MVAARRYSSWFRRPEAPRSAHEIASFEPLPLGLRGDPFRRGCQAKPERLPRRPPRRYREGLPRGEQAHVHPPDDAGYGANEVPPDDGPDEDEVDEAHHGPEAPAGCHEGPEVRPAALRDGGPVDEGVVNSTRGGHGRLDGVIEEAEEESVDGGASGLVEDELGEGVADAEPGLDEIILGGRGIGNLLIADRGGSDGLLGRGGLGGRECLFEKFLPGK